MDSYSISTAAHSRGVAQLVAEFVTAGIVDFNPEQSKLAVKLAIVHDMGKLSISSTILDKAERLSVEEWSQITNHTINGYHLCAISSLNLGAEKTIPILTHHTLQSREYPPREDLEKALSVHDIPLRELDREEQLTNAALIAIADNLEARCPAFDVEKPHPSLRNYIRNKHSRRPYGIENLPDIVKYSFVEAGKINNLNMNGLLNKAIEHVREIFSSKSIEE